MGQRRASTEPTFVPCPKTACVPIGMDAQVSRIVAIVGTTIAGDAGTEHLLSVNALPRLLRSVGPDFGAVGGAGELGAIVGALMTYGVIIAVLMVVVCAVTWGVASAHGSWQTASKAKTGLVVALGGAGLTGGALAWANWLLDVGATL